ncbi:hypothetical protein GCM10008090_32980 [Arenicella chitinivorans]|uniref:Sulfotransferase family protein n=1 Tax=Arenicella chitinivorans TaxID=1329800 RepID=A0A918VT11_9GAMM|nr:hypothetical protein [Arenicella chitinivorans]GHA20359.1 hypothetical protein GCM10008090_32980 [Arenicella chitinivorans]
MSTAYRLVWFQHFHKAAGSSIVELAKMNGEQFWPNHNNGNPLDDSGNELELWEYSNQELASFVDLCEQKGVTFVATEWGAPDIEYLASDNRVVLVTCIRAPLERYVSNFYYDLHNGYTAARTLYDYEATRNRAFTASNYYCRVLADIKDCSIKISAAEFEIAASLLTKFDVCSRLEDGLDELSHSLSWSHKSVHSNRTSTSFSNLAKLLIRGKLKLSYLRLKYPKQKPSAEFVAYFDAANTWDTKLYRQISEFKKIGV